MIIVDIGLIGLIVPLIIIITIFLQIVMNKHVFKWMTEKQKDNDLRSTRVTEMIKGIKIIKFNAWENIVIDLISKIRQLECTKMVQVLRFIGWSDVAIELMPMHMSMVIFGIYNSFFGRLSISQTYSTLTIFNLMFLPTRELNFSLNAIITGFVAINRFEKILQIENREELLDSAKLKKGAIITSSLNPSYKDLAIEAMYNSKTPVPNLNIKSSTDTDRTQAGLNHNNEIDREIVLHDINLNLEPGSFTTIVGPVGSGKSSLLLSLIGEMVYCSGSYYNDGKDQYDVGGTKKDYLPLNTVISKNGSISIITQTANLINATIRDNILFGAEYNERRYRDTLKRC